MFYFLLLTIITFFSTAILLFFGSVIFITILSKIYFYFSCSILNKYKLFYDCLTAVYDISNIALIGCIAIFLLIFFIYHYTAIYFMRCVLHDMKSKKT